MKRALIIIPASFAAILFVLSGLSTPTHASQRPRGAKHKIFAQQLVEWSLARHSDVSGLEISLLSPTGCSTIAASDARDIGEKCDRDELEPIRTGAPSVERGRIFDITLPLHDAVGQIIGAIGIDIRPKSGEQEASVVERAKAIATEVEAEIPSKRKLLEVAD